MLDLLGRRTLVCASALVLCGTISLSACGSDGSSGDDKAIVVAGTPLSTADILLTKSLEDKLPEKKNVGIEFDRAGTVSVLYQDFIAGRYDCIFTDPSAFAEQASQGLPATTVAAVSPNFAYLIAPESSGIKDPSDLAGKRVVAATATGGYKVFTAIANEWYGTDFDDQVEVVQSTSDVDGLSQVSTGKADAMFTFETGVSTSLEADPTMAVVYDQGKDYLDRTGETFWENALVCRTDHDLDPEKIAHVIDVLAETGEAVMDDPKATDEFAVNKLEAQAGSYETAFDSGRLSFDIRPLDDKSKQEMVNVIEFQQQAGTMKKFDIPDSYFDGVK